MTSPPIANSGKIDLDVMFCKEDRCRGWVCLTRRLKIGGYKVVHPDFSSGMVRCDQCFA